MTIDEPVLDEFQIVANAATVNPLPMNVFKPDPLEPVIFERCLAEVKAFCIFEKTSMRTVKFDTIR